MYHSIWPDIANFSKNTVRKECFLNLVCGHEYHVRHKKTGPHLKAHLPRQVSQCPCARKSNLVPILEFSSPRNRNRWPDCILSLVNTQPWNFSPIPSQRPHAMNSIKQREHHAQKGPCHPHSRREMPAYNMQFSCLPSNFPLSSQHTRLWGSLERTRIVTSNYRPKHFPSTVVRREPTTEPGLHRSTLNSY